MGLFDVFRSSRGASIPRTSPPASKQENPYVGLREQALRITREKLGLSPSQRTRAIAVLMDWNVTQGCSTTVAMADGTASIYLSSGGGYIGGSGHEHIRKLAIEAVAAADQLISAMKPASTFDLPQPGTVFFYAVTGCGVMKGTATDAQLNANATPLRPLGDAMQRIISAYLEIENLKK